MSQRRLTASCVQCKSGKSASVTLVRVYTRRRQHDFRYRICPLCREMLMTILRENAYEQSAQAFVFGD